jgi:imidazolonepropionase-like amidohydrolase
VPLDAIRIATLNDATFLGIQDRTGRIQVGKEADLLIVHGNPGERIEEIENVEMIFTNGVAYDPKTLLAKVKGQVGWQ